MFMEINDLDKIDEYLKSQNEIMLLKFDNKESKYNEYFSSLDLKIINITDKDIISFYEIETLPTVLVYKNRNLLDSIIGFKTKTELIKNILNLIQ